MSAPELVAKASQVMRAERQRLQQARGERVDVAELLPGIVLAELVNSGKGGVALESIRAKVDGGERITPQEGLWLLTEAPLIVLAELANVWRFRHNPDRRVTFVIDTNPNYTNYCDADCLFCAFYRKPGDNEEGYAYSIDELMGVIGRSVDLGATTVLLQGGLHDAIPFEYYLDVVREFNRRFPNVHPHLYSAPEIGKMREVSGLSYDDILAALREAGLETMPGGGAEILSDRVRMRLSPKKQSCLEWIEIHKAAHRQGLRTTATMMYGHAEQPVDIIEHLECLRRVQDEAGIRHADSGVGQAPAGAGFTAFIPWSYKPGNTPFEGKFPDEVGPAVYLRVLAVSRIYLDNIQHIQSSWFSEGKKAGQVALHFGTDDFGGTLIEENVLAEAAHHVKTTAEETVQLIRESGFIPARRGSPLYDVVETY